MPQLTDVRVPRMERLRRAEEDWLRGLSPRDIARFQRLSYAVVLAMKESWVAKWDAGVYNDRLTQMRANGVEVRTTVHNRPGRPGRPLTAEENTIRAEYAAGKIGTRALATKHRRTRDQIRALLGRKT